jgi:hypothetical protein
MRGRQLFINLHSTAKFKRRFLKLFILQVNFTLFDVSDLCFFGIGAAGDCK